jgi:Type II CAAX prenyl endopeptidase Rce1-like
MTADTVRVLMSVGVFMLLLFLRLDARRFGAAEYDEPGLSRGGFWTRLSWYGVGLALLAGIYVMHPSPANSLYLLLGRRSEVALIGLAIAVLGIAQAAAFAWFRYGDFRLPPARAYPDAIINAVGTAVIDEATFRGVLLGALIAVGIPDGLAILTGTLVYILATRLAAPGHSLYAVLLAGGIGLVTGWATLACVGIGAAIIGHAATSFAVFVFTGHAGQVPLAGREPEEIEARLRPPEGWRDARPALAAGRAAESGDLDFIGPSGYGDRLNRGRGRRSASGSKGGTRSPGTLHAMVGRLAALVRPRGGDQAAPPRERRGR